MATGLYALERLGQANPAHRQTFVNIVCAYLRTPFDVSGSTLVRTAAEENRDEQEGP